MRLTPVIDSSSNSLRLVPMDYACMIMTVRTMGIYGLNAMESVWAFSLRIIPLNLRFRSAGGMKPVIAHDGIQRKDSAAVKYDTTMALDSHDITDSMTAG